MGNCGEDKMSISNTFCRATQVSQLRECHLNCVSFFRLNIFFPLTPGQRQRSVKYSWLENFPLRGLHIKSLKWMICLVWVHGPSNSLISNSSVLAMVREEDTCVCLLVVGVCVCFVEALSLFYWNFPCVTLTLILPQSICFPYASLATKVSQRWTTPLMWISQTLTLYYWQACFYCIWALCASGK